MTKFKSSNAVKRNSETIRKAIRQTKPRKTGTVVVEEDALIDPAQLNIENKFGDRAIVTAANGVNVTVEETAENAEVAPRRKKWITFIGNLPYGMTEERLREFLNLDSDLIEVRLPRNSKSRERIQGYAFCEFNNNAALRKCLLMHHTKLEGRRINVELTAGAGGNSVRRKNRIAKKNKSANEWRARRAKKLELQKDGKETGL
uniref:RRM domain-containing protein n=1 Tax=Spongospora subterranea TaxID=70186 RepID=A0A0H5RPF4_9EUKA|eukprot:CRZ10604.1 hypothetical protein [Spongospora subterranea]